MLTSLVSSLLAISSPSGTVQIVAWEQLADKRMQLRDVASGGVLTSIARPEPGQMDDRSQIRWSPTARSYVLGRQAPAGSVMLQGRTWIPEIAVSSRSNAFAVLSELGIAYYASNQQRGGVWLRFPRIKKMGFRRIGEATDHRLAVSPTGDWVAFSGERKDWVSYASYIRACETWLWQPANGAVKRLGFGAPVAWITDRHLLQFSSVAAADRFRTFIADVSGSHRETSFRPPWNGLSLEGFPMGAGDGYVVFYYQTSRDPLRLYRFTPPAKLTRVSFKMAPELKGKPLGDFLIRVVKK